MGQKRPRPVSSPSSSLEPISKRISKPASTTDRKILVAVDFGTTFSGLAWAQTGNPDSQTPIFKWPDSISAGLEGKTSDKVPTEIAYEGETYLWGFQIPDHLPRRSWFKLELDSLQSHGSTLTNQYPNPLAAPPAYGIDAEKIVTDYLTALRKHAEQVLRYQIPESALNSVPVQKCAEKAGMGDARSLQLISEPEAAAVYALKATMHANDIKAGNTYVLCDAGGGTVDLITYTVAHTQPHLVLTEASVGTGSSCGSSFLNRRFQEFLEKKLGEDANFDAEVIADATRYFEDVVKRNFRGTFGETFLVPVPGMNNEALGIRRNKLKITGSEIRQIFEPILDNITELVISQMKASNKNINAVLLVGGLGQNAYVRDEILKEVRTLSATTEVLQSARGWTAVVRGALMKGLSSLSKSYATVRISERTARKHYGLSLSPVWKPGMGGEHRRIYDKYSGDYLIPVFHCFVEKGSKIKEEQAIRVKFYTERLVSTGTIGTNKTTILSFSDPNNEGKPQNPEHPGIRDLVEVTADLSHLPVSSFPIKTGADGMAYYVAHFEIEIKFYSAHTTYELIYDGKNYGPVSAEYV